MYNIQTFTEISHVVLGTAVSILYYTLFYAAANSWSVYRRIAGWVDA
jgi:hypothetical protein